MDERDPTRDQDTMRGNLANWKIATYALYLLGGTSQTVHTEDVAIKCYELARDIFSWVRHPQYPDKDIVRSALMDARKEKNGSLVTGRAGRGSGQRQVTGTGPRADGWQLTADGVKWVMANEETLAQILGQREPRRQRQTALMKLARITDHPAFREFLRQPKDFTPSIGDVAEMMRCRVDAGPEVWQDRIRTFRNLAEALKNKDVLAFLKCCEDFLRCQDG